MAEGWPVVLILPKFCLQALEAGKTYTWDTCLLSMAEEGRAIRQGLYSQKASYLEFLSLFFKFFFF